MSKCKRKKKVQFRIKEVWQSKKAKKTKPWMGQRALRNTTPSLCAWGKNLTVSRLTLLLCTLRKQEGAEGWGRRQHGTVIWAKGNKWRKHCITDPAFCLHRNLHRPKKGETKQHHNLTESSKDKGKRLYRAGHQRQRILEIYKGFSSLLLKINHICPG